MLASLTPIVLTYNEEPNIGRTLESLRWAKQVIVVDSGSTDATEKIARSFPNVRWFVRKFDSFGGQWTFAFTETGIASEYVLALDADMTVTAALLEEIQTQFLPGGFAGGVIPIEWCYSGKPLLGSFCPPQLRLFRPTEVRASQVGHAHHFAVQGRLYPFKHGVWHEDRKSVERWLQSQAGYSRHEEDRLRSGEKLRLRDRLRASGWMPFLAVILSYLRAGGPFGGKRALRYAWERTTFETVLAIRVIDRKLAEEENREQR